jgi:hypothetical protein
MKQEKCRDNTRDYLGVVSGLDTTKFDIQFDKKIIDLASMDIVAKNKVEFLFFNLQHTFEVNDLINQFPNLSEIQLSERCSGINITSAPSNLTSLIINGTNYPIKNLSKLKCIKKIEFTDHIYNDYYYKILKDFEYLNHLILYLPFDYKIIDTSVIALTNLETLEIKATSLKSIPIEICKMKGLKELTVESDKFLRIPDCIFEMENLQIITYIGNNEKDLSKFNKKYKDNKKKINIKTLSKGYYYRLVPYNI